MNNVEINKSMHLSEHLASPSEAALSHSSELDGLRLSPNFSLGEVCKTSHKTADGNMKRWGLTGDRFLSVRKRRVYLTGTCPLSDREQVKQVKRLKPKEND